MELGSLSEIFNDPLLNEFTDSLLDDIDVNEFQYFHSKGSTDPSGTVLEERNVKYDVSVENKLDKSGHATLEALLKSQPPSSCVPPAPELRSDVSIGVRKCKVAAFRGTPVSTVQSRRNSLPIFKYESGSPTERINQSCKSKLISDYLEMCGSEIPPNAACKSRVVDQETWHGSAAGHSNVDFPNDHFYPNPFLPSHIEDTPNNCTSATNTFASQSECTKFSSESDESACQSKCDNKTVRRAPHNAIEKRYRASINGRIDELRKLLIPNPNNDAKLNKSAVLRQAIERIKELEEKNYRLQAELTALRSLHGSAHIKPYNSSPDSGISSFEPSSSCSSSYSALDGDNLTPPSAGLMNGTAFHVPSNNSTYAVNDIGNSTNESVDVFSSMWTLDPTAPANFSRYHESEPLRSTQRSHPHDVTAVELLPYHSALCSRSQCMTETTSYVNLRNESGVPLKRQSDTTLYALAPNGTRFKRRAVSIHPSQTKVRRHMVPASAYTDNHQPIPANVTRSGSLLIKASTTQQHSGSESHLQNFPTVRHLLRTNNPASEPATIAPIQTETHSQGAVVVGSGFDGLAARTTLCVAALCLIALDPVVLSGTASDPLVSKKESSPSRRLLSVLNNYGQTSTPWLVWFAYFVQWVIALCLCIWACQRRCSRSIRTVNKQNQDSPETFLEAANKAIDQGCWSLAEHKLLTCLTKFDSCARIRSSSGSVYFGKIIVPQLCCLVDWITFINQALFGLLFRMPSIIWIVRLKETKPKCADQSRAVKVPEGHATLSDVRWRLLEVYFLAPRDSLMGPSAPGGLLPFLRLLWNCLCDFIDDCLVALRGPDRLVARPVSASLLRRGFTLTFILNKTRIAEWTTLSSALQYLIRICIRQLAHSSRVHTLWTHLADNSILLEHITGQSPLNLTNLPSASPKEDQLEKSVLEALQQMLIDRCLRVITTDRRSDLSNLNQYVTTLLDLCSFNNTDSFGSLETSSDEISTVKSRAHWWAQFIQVLWIDELRSVPSFSDLHSSSIAPNAIGLDAPPQSVLQCAQTGSLAEAAWLVYRFSDTQLLFTSPLYFHDAVLATQKSGLMLFQFLKQQSSHHSADGHNRDASVLSITPVIPFWMLACAQLIADRALSILARALFTSKGGHDRAFESPQPSRLIESFNAALWVLRQSSSLISADQSDWVVKRLSYYETVRRLISGANPVHSRFSLMHACTNFSRKANQDNSRELLSLHSPRDSLVPSTNVSRLSSYSTAFSDIRESHTARLIPLNTSPGQ